PSTIFTLSLHDALPISLLRRVEGSEDPVALGRGNARTGVLELELQAAVGRPPARREGIGALAPPGAEREAAPALHRVDRVRDEVDDDPIERLRVRLEGRHVPRVLADHDDLSRLDLIAVQ